MAKLSSQGDLLLTINGESKTHFWCEAKDPFRIRVGGGGDGGGGGERRKFLESSVGIQRSKRGVLSPGCGRVCSLGKRRSTGFSRAEEQLDGDGDDGEEEEVEDELSCFRGLVMDISYRPINVVCWHRAICLEFMKKVDVLEYYDQTVS